MADGELNFPVVMDTPEIGFTVQAASVIPTATDSTLTVSGMAADAKATGDAIAAVDDKIGTVPGSYEDMGQAVEGYHTTDSARMDTNEALQTTLLADCGLIVENGHLCYEDEEE